MNPHPNETWRRLKAAYRPDVPELDTAAIMAAVRREAQTRPLPRPAPGLAVPLPTWACAAAASLALLAAVGVGVRSLHLADQQIGQAWMHTVQPDEFAEAILPFGGSIL